MSRLRRIGFRLCLLALVALLVFAGVEVVTWPDVASLASRPPADWAFLERSRDRGVEPRHQWMPYASIAADLKIAVLVAEDINFFSHSGFDTGELEKAVREAMAGERRLRGASTLTQQLAKNLWLTPSRSPWRKVKEAILTRQLEAALDKRRILEVYLNVVEFGPGFFGAEAAARHYFSRPAASVSARQAALLAASLPHSSWYPGGESAAYRAHVDRIERRMVKAGGWLRREI